MAKKTKTYVVVNEIRGKWAVVLGLFANSIRRLSKRLDAAAVRAASVYALRQKTIPAIRAAKRKWQERVGWASWRGY